MKYDGITRRHFLQGMSHFALSLPFLPSLFVRKAFADEPFVGKCFFAMGTEHGGIRDLDLFGSLLGYKDTPHEALSKYLFLPGGTEGTKVYPNHEFHYGNLVNFLRTAAESGETDDPDRGEKRLSYIIGSHFNPYLPKMNILRGIDLHFGDSGHHQGLYLGNLGSKQNGPTDMPRVPSIDTVLAQSDKFYPNLNGVTRRQLVAGVGRSMSFDLSGASITSPTIYTDEFFKTIFGTPETIAENGQNSSIADSVLEDYRRFVSPVSATGRRISSEDKNVLERFIDHVNEIQRSLNSTAVCGTTAPPKRYKTLYSPESQPAIWKVLADTIALAFSCGACRVFTAIPGVSNLTRNTGFSDDYHHHVAHNHTTEFAAHRIFHRTATDEVFYQVIKTLDSYSGVVPGTTMLDQSLCTYQPESGIRTHNPMNNIAITAGSAGGFFNTGKYIDFRSLQNQSLSETFRAMGGRPGIFLNQYFANILMSMGLSPSDYEKRDVFKGPGYGSWSLSARVAQNNGHIGHPSALVARSGQKIPIWTK